MPLFKMGKGHTSVECYHGRGGGGRVAGDMLTWNTSHG